MTDIAQAARAELAKVIDAADDTWQHGIGDSGARWEDCVAVAVAEFLLSDESVEQVALAIWRGYVGDSLSGWDKHAYAYDREKAEYVARAALSAVLGANHKEGSK